MDKQDRQQQIREGLDKVLEKLMNLGARTKEERTSQENDQLAAFNRRDSGIDIWDWPQGVGLYGLIDVMELEKSDKYRDFLLKWYDRNIAAGLPCRNINTTAPLLSLTRFADAEHPEYRALALDWAEWVMKELPRTENGGFEHVTSGDEFGRTVRRNENQLWVDTLFMAVLFLNRLGQQEGRKDWTDEAERQFLTHIKYLFDTNAGLFYHGWTFEGRNNFGCIHWCRGDSWYTVAVPDYLEDCGENIDPAVRNIIVSTFREQVTALKALQAEDGLWHTVLDDPTSYEETSGSAAIAAGILKGIRTGLLDESFAPMAEKAVDGILSQIAEDGTVLSVSAGTGMGMDIEHYRHIMIAPMAYGQSLTILALVEALRYESMK